MKATQKIILAILTLALVIGIVSAFAMTASAGPSTAQWYKQSVYVTNTTGIGYWAYESVPEAGGDAYHSRSMGGTQENNSESNIEFLISATSDVTLKINYGYRKYQDDVFSITFENVVGTQATAADNISASEDAATLVTGSKELTINEGNVVKVTIKYTKNETLSPADELVYFNFYVNDNLINGNDAPGTYLSLGDSQTEDTLDLKDKRLAQGDKIVRFDSGAINVSTARTLGSIIRYYAMGTDAASDDAVYADEYVDGYTFMSSDAWDTASGSSSALKAIGWTETVGGETPQHAGKNNASNCYSYSYTGATWIWPNSYEAGSTTTSPITADTNLYPVLGVKLSGLASGYTVTADYTGAYKTVQTISVTDGAADFNFDKISVWLRKSDDTVLFNNDTSANVYSNYVHSTTNYAFVAGESYDLELKLRDVAESGKYYFLIQYGGTISGVDYYSAAQVVTIDVTIEPATITVGLKDIDRTYGWDGAFGSSNFGFTGDSDDIISLSCAVSTVDYSARLSAIDFGTAFSGSNIYDTTVADQRKVGTYGYKLSVTSTELADFDSDNGNYTLVIDTTEKNITVVPKEITVSSCSVNDGGYNRQYDGTTDISITAYSAWGVTVASANVSGYVTWSGVEDTATFKIASAKFASKDASTTGATVYYTLATDNENYRVNNITTQELTQAAGCGILPRVLDIYWTAAYESTTLNIPTDKGTSASNRYSIEYTGTYITFIPHVSTDDADLKTLLEAEVVSAGTESALSKRHVGQYDATAKVIVNNGSTSNYEIASANKKLYCEITKATLTINMKQPVFEMQYDVKKLGDFASDSTSAWEKTLSDSSGLKLYNFTNTFIWNDSIVGVKPGDRLTEITFKVEGINPSSMPTPADTLYPISCDGFTINGAVSGNYNIEIAQIEGAAPSVKVVKGVTVISITTTTLSKNYGLLNSDIYKSTLEANIAYTKSGNGTVLTTWQFKQSATTDTDKNIYDSTDSDKRGVLSSGEVYTVNLSLDTTSGAWSNAYYTFVLDGATDEGVLEMSLTINPLPVSVTISATTVYGDADVTYSVTASSIALPFSEALSVLTLDESKLNATSSTNVTYSVGEFYNNGKVAAVSGATSVLDNANYVGTVNASSTFVVNQRPITVAPVELSDVEYGCTIAELRSVYFNKAASYTVVYTGDSSKAALVGTDTINYNTLATNYNYSGDISSTSGYQWKYDIVTPNLTFISNRYDVTFTSGAENVNVIPRKIYFKVDTTAYTITRVYNGATTFADTTSSWVTSAYSDYSVGTHYVYSAKNTATTKALLLSENVTFTYTLIFVDDSGVATANVTEVAGIKIQTPANTAKYEVYFDDGTAAGETATSKTLKNESTTKEIKITPKTVIDVPHDKITKYFDGTTAIADGSVTFKENASDTEYAFEISGLLAADVGKVYFTYNSSTSAYATSAVTSSCNVTLTDITLTSDNGEDGNYAWNSAGAKTIATKTYTNGGKIIQKDITVELTEAGIAAFPKITYGAATTPVEYTDSSYFTITGGLIAGHTATLTVSADGYAQGDNVGKALGLKPTAMVIKDGASSDVTSYYNITYTTSSGITNLIVPREITVSLAGNVTKTYGTADATAFAGITYALDNVYGSEFTQLASVTFGKVEIFSRAKDKEDVTVAGTREYRVYVSDYTLPAAAKGEGDNWNYTITVALGTSSVDPLTTGMYSNYSFIINKKVISIVDELEFKDKVYDASNTAECDVLASNTNLFDNGKFVTWPGNVADDVSIASVTATFPTDSAANQATITITSVVIGGASKDNYTVTVNQTGAKAAIFRRPVYVSGLVAIDRPYAAGTTTVTIDTTGVVFKMLNLDGTALSATDGVYAVDASTFTLTASASIASPNVIWENGIYAGTEAERDATMVLSLSNSNYIIFDAATIINSVAHDTNALETVYTADVTITAYRLDVAYTANDKVYDYTTDATVKSYIYSLPYSGQSIKVTGVNPQFDDADAGNRTVTIERYEFSASTVEGHASDYLNYLPNPTSSLTATAKINPRNVTVSNLALDEFYYSGSKKVDVALMNLSGMSFTMAPTYTATPNGLGIFGDDSMSVNIIGEIVLNNPNVQYNPENPNEIISQLINITIELVGVDSDSVSYKNYNLLNVTYTISAKIIPLPITITPKDGQSMFYGDPYFGKDISGNAKPLAFDYQVEGIATINTPLSYLGSDMLTTITETPGYTGALGIDLTGDVYSYEGSTHAKVGNYDIIKSDFALALKDSFNPKNYNMTFTEGVEFEIEQRQIVIEPTAGQTAIYGEDFTIDFTATNLVDGEVPGFTGALATSGLYVAVSNEITLGTLALADGEDGKFIASNYDIALSGTPVDFEITKRSIEISLDYSTPGVIYNGLTSYTINNSTAYPINGTVPSTATYDPNQAMAYDDKIDALAIGLLVRYAGTYSTSATGDAAIDTIAAVITSAADVSATDLAFNYDITFDVTVTVTPKELKLPSTMLAMTLSKVYDGKAEHRQPLFSASGTSFGETMGMFAVDNTSANNFALLFALSGKNVGSYPNTTAGNSITNIDLVSDSTASDIEKIIASYTVNTERITVQIAKKDISVKIIGGKVYDATPYVTKDTDFTMSATALATGDVFIGNSYKSISANIGNYTPASHGIVRNLDESSNPMPSIKDSSGADMTGNYNITLDAASKITITQRSIIITFDKTATYNASTQTVSYDETDCYTLTGDGLIATHSFTAGAYITGSANVGTYTVGSSTMTLTQSTAFAISDGTNDVTANYDITFATAGSLEITPAPLTITGITITAPYYYTGAMTLTVSDITYSVEGYQGTGTVAATDLIELSNSAWSAKDAGTTTIDFKATIKAPYDASYYLVEELGVFKTVYDFEDVELAEGEDGILPAEIYISQVNNVFGKSYNATTNIEVIYSATDFSYNLTVNNGAIVAADNIAYQPESIAWAGVNAGTTYAVTYGEFNSDNYTLVKSDGTPVTESNPLEVITDAAIIKAPLIVSPVAGQSKMYLSTDPAFVLQYHRSRLANTATGGNSHSSADLNITFDTDPASFGTTALTRAPGESIGTYAFYGSALALSNNGTFLASNYEIVYSATSTFEITPRTITVTPISTSKEFGSADPTMKFEFQIDTTDLAAGIPVPGTNDVITYVSSTYGTINYATPYTSCDILAGALARYLSGTTATAPEVPEGEKVGFYNILAGDLTLVDDSTIGFLASNYELKIVETSEGESYTTEAGSGKNEFEITKAKLTLKAESFTVIYGDAAPIYTFTLEGLMFGENPEDVYDATGLYAESPVYGANSPVKAGGYQINFYDEFGNVLTGTNNTYGVLPDDSSYEWAADKYVEGTVTVLKKLIVLVIDDDEITYGDLRPAVSVIGDSENTFDYNSAAYTAVTYKTDRNYDFVGSDDFGSLIGYSNFTSTCDYGVGSNVGGYAVTAITTIADINARLQNYTVIDYDTTDTANDIKPGTLTVNKFVIYISPNADSVTKTYGENDPAASDWGWELGAGQVLPRGEVISYSSVTFTRAAGENAGNYAYNFTVSLTMNTLGANTFKPVNYEVQLAKDADQNDLTFVIEKKPITVSGVVANDRIYDATTDVTFDISNMLISGLVNTTLTNGIIINDTVTGAIILTPAGSFTDKNAGTNKSVEFNYTITGTSADNYVIDETTSQLTAEAEISPKEVTISGILADNKNYDRTTAATLDISGAVITGFITGDDLGFTATGVFNSKNVWEADTVTITYVALTGVDANNYALNSADSQQTASASIAKIGLTVSGITAANKVYDKTDAVEFLYGEATFVGLLGEEGDKDKVQVLATGVFPSINVGTYRIEIAIALVQNEENGKDSGNYYVMAGSQEAVNAQILQVELHITIDNVNAAYGTLNSDLVLTYVCNEADFVDEEDKNNTVLGIVLSTNYDSEDPNNRNVNKYTITGTSNALVNYKVIFTNGELNITRKALEIKPDDLTINYGDEIPTYTVSYNELASWDAVSIGEGTRVFDGTLIFNCTYTKGAVVGTYPISIITSTLSNANYVITYIEGSLIVDKAPLTVTIGNANVIYGEALPTGWKNNLTTISITGFVLGQSESVIVNKNGLLFGTTYTPGDPTSADIEITASGIFLLSSNYSLTYVPGKLTVDKRPIKIQANDYSALEYGEATAAAGYGFTVTSDTPYGIFGSDDLVVTYTYGDYAIGKGIGEYPITPVGGNENYEFECVDGKLTVIPRVVVITIKDKTIVYGNDGENDGFDAVKTILAEDITSLHIEYKYYVPSEAAGTEYVAGNNVGEYVISIVYTENENYDITVVNGKLTVAKREITVKPDDITITYGDDLPDTKTYQITVGSIFGTDSIGTPEYIFKNAADEAYVAGSNAGTYTITVTGLANSNYTITLETGTLTVNKKALTVSVINPDPITYGDDKPSSFEYGYTGIYEAKDTEATIFGEGFAPTITCSYVKGDNVGDYAIVISGYPSELTNYILTIENGTLTVKPKEITVTANDAEITYGDAPINNGYVVDGLIAGDTLTGIATISYNYTTGDDAGEYAISVSGLSNSNYIVEFVDGVLTVNKAELTLTAIVSGNITYGDVLPTFTYTISGFVLGETETTVFASNPVSYVCDYARGSNAGDYAVTPTYGEFEPTNYFVTEVDATLTVDKKPLSFYIENATVVYGEIPSYSIVWEGFIADGEGGTINDNFENSLVGSFTFYAPDYRTSANVGKYKIVVSMADGYKDNQTNYVITEDTTKYTDTDPEYTNICASLTVTKRPLTIQANDITLPYGSAIPEYTYTIVDNEGIADGLNVNDLIGDVITIQISSIYAQDANASATAYPITVVEKAQGAKYDNYDITLVDAGVTVVARELIITPVLTTKLFGTVDPVIKYVVGATFNNQVPVITGALSRESAGEADAVGSFDVLMGTLALNSAPGFISTNYVLKLVDFEDKFVITNVLIETLKANVSLKDVININYGYGIQIYGDITLKAGGVLEWTADQYAALTSYDYEANTAYNRTLYRATSIPGCNYMSIGSDIAAKNYSETYYTRPYVVIEGEDGDTYIYGDVYEYSVQTYAAKVFAQTSPAFDSFKTTMIAMLDYGAAAQTYFNYNTDKLANDIVTTSLRSAYGSTYTSALDAPQTTPEWTIRVDGALNTGLNWQGIRLSLGEAFRIDFGGAMGVSGLTAENFRMIYWTQAQYEAAKAAGTLLNPADATALTVQKSGNTVMARISGIAAKNAGDKYYVAMEYTNDSGDKSYSYVYEGSVNIYATRSIYSTSAGATADFKALAKALLVYTNAAKAYFGN